MNRAEKYIEIVARGLSPTGRTKRWEVKRKDQQEPFGWISWNGAWRRYVFHVNGGSYFDHDCLRLIADFLAKETNDHMAGRKNKNSIAMQ